MGRVHFSALLEAGITRIFGFDISEEARQTFEEENKIPCFSVDQLSSAVSEHDIKGLIFATTTPGRAVAIEEALGFKSIDWVVTEKPFASSVQEAETLVKLVESKGKRLAINHQMRFMEQYRLVKSLASSIKLGPVVGMNVAGFNIGLANNGSHYFEAFRFLAEDDLLAVSAIIDFERRPSHRGASFWDYSGAVIGVGRKGAKFLMDLSQASGAGLLVTYSFVHGKIVIDELGGNYTTVTRSPEDFHLNTLSYGTHPMVVNSGVFLTTDLVSSTRQVIEATIAGVDYPDHLSAMHSLLATIGSVVSGENQGAAQHLDQLKLGGLEAGYSREFPWS